MPPALKTPSRLSHLILTLALVLGVTLRIVGTAGKKTIEPDEGISYMAATGHLGEYFAVDQHSPFGVWVEASAWKRFLRVERPFCFRQIAYDLARYDIHPPLYFWLLHLWSLIVGIHLWTGPLLNILFFIMSVPLLFRLANYILKDPADAALATFVWALSPLVMGVSCLARPYDLLALSTILITLQTVRLVDNSIAHNSKIFIYIAISSAAGLLAHYYFLIILLGCAVFLFVKLIKTNGPLLRNAFIAMASGLVIFFVMHPHFLSSFRYQASQNQPFQFGEMLPRLKITFATFGTFFWQGMPIIFKVPPSILYGLIYPAVFVAVVILLSILYIKSRKDSPGLPRLINNTENYVIFFFIWTAGIVIIIYLFGYAPTHAMGAKYMTVIWPYFAFIPVLIIRAIPKYKLQLARALILMLVLFGSLDMIFMNYPNNKRPEPVSWLKNSSHIIIDNMARGVLPGLVWHIPDTTLVFAADQEYLIEYIDKWFPMMNEGDLYLSVLRYDSTLKRQQEILNIIKLDYDVVAASGGYWGYGSMYKLQKRNIDANH